MCCALDLNPRRLSPRTPGVLRVLASLDALPFRPRSFDLVVCFRHLQHVLQEEECARRLAQLAHVTRRLLLSYYSPGTLHGVQRELLCLARIRTTRLGLREPAWVHAQLRGLGLRVLQDEPLLPLLHAQRLLLAERIENREETLTPF